MKQSYDSTNSSYLKLLLIFFFFKVNHVFILHFCYIFVFRICFLQQAKKTQKSSSHLPLFHSATKAIVWGMQNRAVQSMLDFDYVCRRKQPSVVGIINPFTGSHMQKYFWGAEEVFIPVYKEMKKAMNDHADADVMVNFASLRSAYSCSIECLDYPQIKTVAIIAEGIPENHTRKLIKLSNQKKVIVIGPATVGGIKSGCFKIGNTAGLTDNILESKLYRPGSVAYVSKSGGLSNELNNIIAKTSDGVYEGVAVGGDRYPGTTFLDHILRSVYRFIVNYDKIFVIILQINSNSRLIDTIFVRYGHNLIRKKKVT